MLDFTFSKKLTFSQKLTFIQQLVSDSLIRIRAYPSEFVLT